MCGTGVEGRAHSSEKENIRVPGRFRASLFSRGALRSDDAGSGIFTSLLSWMNGPWLGSMGG